MIELKALLTAEWASQDSTNRLVIANTFDTVYAAAAPGTQLPPEGVRLNIPALHVVFILTASIADNTDHRGQLHIVHEDGQPVVEPIQLPIKFILNPDGRPMKFQGLVNLSGLPVTAPADYTIRLFVDGREMGETPMFVELKVADDA